MVSIRTHPYEPKMFKQVMLNGYEKAQNTKDKSMTDSFYFALDSDLRAAHAFEVSSVMSIMEHSPWNTSNMFPPFSSVWIESLTVDAAIFVVCFLDDDGYEFVMVPFVRNKSGSILGPCMAVIFRATKEGETILRDDGRINFRVKDLYRREKEELLGKGLCATPYKLVANFLGLVNAANISCPHRTFEVNHHTKRRLDAKNANRYHILKIHKPGEKIKKNSETGENEGKKPLHVVRGHLADYTENGLFGKYFGTFFIPSHVRGNEKNGTVTKDYALI